MLDELEVLRLVAKRLESAGLRYMVSGSTALNFYGQPRMTRDLDLVIELDSANVDGFVHLFEEDFYCDPEEVREAVTRRGMFNLVYLERILKIDFIVRKDSAYRRGEFARRRLLRVEGAALWVVAPEDLVLSKLHWAKDSRSELQLRDVRGLLAVLPGLDREYLDRWARELEIVDLLEEVQR